MTEEEEDVLRYHDYEKTLRRARLWVFIGGTLLAAAFLLLKGDWQIAGAIGGLYLCLLVILSILLI